MRQVQVTRKPTTHARARRAAYDTLDARTERTLKEARYATMRARILTARAEYFLNTTS